MKCWHVYIYGAPSYKDREYEKAIWEEFHGFGRYFEEDEGYDIDDALSACWRAYFAGYAVVIEEYK